MASDYRYTDNGLLSNIRDGVDNAYSASYGYNYRNQLTPSYRNYVTTSYSLDDWGNLTGSSRSAYTTFKYPS